MAVERLWQLYAEPDELGCSGNSISRYDNSYLNARSPLPPSTLKLYSDIHFILESDISSELIGSPPTSSLRCSNDFCNLFRSNSNAIPKELDQDIVGDRTLIFLYKAFLWLRIFLNRILGTLYTTEKAYCHPKDIGPVVAELTEALDSWYHSLPLDMQFAREPTSFRVASQKQSPHLLELSLRYYTCIFLLIRPVLYFVLHEDMEYPSELSSWEGQCQPWMVESSRRTVESMVMILLAHGERHALPSARWYLSWCDIQVLMAAFMVLLQVRVTSLMDYILSPAGNLDNILDMAEVVLEDAPFVSVGVKRILDIVIRVS
ncbi:hypothetical protein V1504DRAFT_434083 [Lipomyces starkeyi]